MSSGARGTAARNRGDRAQGSYVLGNARNRRTETRRQGPELLVPQVRHPSEHGTPADSPLPKHLPLCQRGYRRARVMVRSFQNFCTELTWTFSSGEWAPWMLGPKLIISISG